MGYAHREMPLNYHSYGDRFIFRVGKIYTVNMVCILKRAERASINTLFGVCLAGDWDGVCVDEFFNPPLKFVSKHNFTSVLNMHLYHLDIFHLNLVD